VNPLTGRDSRAFLLFVHFANPVRKNPRSVDDCIGLELILVTCFLIKRLNTGYPAIWVLQQPFHAHVVERAAALVIDGLSQINSQPGIIKLPVPVNHTSFQATRIQIGQAPGSLISRQTGGFPDA